MRCHEVHDLLVPLRDAELAPSEVTLVERHLAGCAPCRALDQALQQVTPRPVPPPSDRAMAPLWDRLDRAIAEELDHPQRVAPPSVSSRMRTRLRDEVPISMATAVAYAAALLLVGLWGMGQWQQTRDLQVALDAARSVPATGDVLPAEVMPTDAYRAASWTPPIDEAP